MADKIQAIRGMNDILPEKTPLWQKIERSFAFCMKQYGYEEIRFPLLESTALFARSIGEVTDIVEKEMYTFADKNGENLTLRPEGTAGCIRACIENGLLYNQQPKLWYQGPMFRYEKPQKGRYRQFHQIGAEALHIAGVTIELELIALCARFFGILGIKEHLSLHINTLGEMQERQEYKSALVAYFTTHQSQLDEDSLQRLHKNPLRILDSKHPAIQSIIANAPRFIDYIGEESRQHFTQLCEGIEQLGIAYTINYQLVRGLDYYNGTVFEWVTDKLGSQAAVCGGGRYDGLVAQLGGAPTKAVGFALGLERLVLLLETLFPLEKKHNLSTFFIISTTQQALLQGLLLAEKIRNNFPTCCVLFPAQNASIKSQFKKADKSGADFALILGEEEVEKHTVSIKSLRKSVEQINVPQEEISLYISKLLSGEW